MPGGVLIGTSGGARVGSSGGVRATNAQGKCPTCGCGGGGGPFTWPTSGWIVGTPCASTIGTDKPVIFRASILASSPLLSGGALPFGCFAEQFYNATLGKYGCAVFSYNGTVLTLTEAEATGGTYNVATTSWGGGYNPRDCCYCAGSTAEAYCGLTDYTDTSFSDPGHPLNYADVPITFAIPQIRDGWNAGAACIYRCCCPQPGDGRTVTHSLSFVYDAHTVYPAGSSIKRFDRREEVSGSGTMLSMSDTVTYTRDITSITTFDDDSTSGGTVSDTLDGPAGACQPHAILMANFVTKGPYNQSTGTITIGCNSFSMNVSWDYYEVDGTHQYGSIVVTETITRAGDCDGECANAPGCVSGEAMFALIGDMLFDP